MEVLGGFIFVSLGLVVGSFLNVLIYRLPISERIGGLSRSKCPACRKILKASHLIPVVSFLWLRGKCAFCQKKISWQYPLVELATAVLFVLAWCKFSNILFVDIQVARFILDLVFLAAMVVVFMIDWREMLILDRVIYPVAGAVALLQIYINHNNWSNLINLGLAALLGFLFYFVQFRMSRGRWVGGGDMKLGALLGLTLGLSGLAMTLFISYVGGALIVLALMLLGRKTLKSAVPMAVFLVPAAIVVILYGGEIIELYLKILSYVALH